MGVCGRIVASCAGLTFVLFLGKGVEAAPQGTGVLPKKTAESETGLSSLAGSNGGHASVTNIEEYDQGMGSQCRNIAPSAGPVPYELLERCGGYRSQESPSSPALTAILQQLGPILLQETETATMNTTTVPGIRTLATFGALVPSPGSDYPADVELLLGDTTHVYQLTSHGAASSYDTSGMNTPLSNIAPPAGMSWVDMATDPTTGLVYAASTACGTMTKLSTVSLTAGTSAPIGTITNSPCLIALAFTNAGDLYGYDVQNDSLLSINKSNGEGMIVGPLGFNANFNQSMDCDPNSAICYLFAFNVTTFRSELRSVNLATGATTFLAVIGVIAPGRTVEASGAVFGTIGATCNTGPTIVNSGIDLFSTPSTGSSYDDFGATPLPPGFFGPGSNQFAGRITFRGSPLNPGVLGPTDTIVKRNAAATLIGPGASKTIPIEIAALSLASIDPITVTYTPPVQPELWDVKTCLSNVVAQSLGTMTITAGPCQGEGGTFTSTLFVSPRLVFTRRGDGVTRVFDPVAMGALPIDFASRNGHWVETPDPALTLTTVAPGLTVDHDCDPNTPAIGPLPGTSNFFPGVRSGVQAASEMSGLVVNCGPQKKRLTAEEARTYAVGHYPLPAQGPMDDFDHDGLPNDADNCPGIVAGGVTFNPLQEDADDDGIGDICDTCPAISSCNQTDSDGDGRGDLCDDCIFVPNYNQQGDADDDGFGNSCDNCPAIRSPDQTDNDHDGRGNLCDNCISAPNFDQIDFDHDGEGDACDLNDGLNIITSLTNAGISWQPENASSFNVYRGSLTRLFATGEYTQDPAVEPEAARFCGRTGTSLSDSRVPPLGQANFYLVNSILGGVESSLGTRSNGTTRPNDHPCPP